MSTEFENKIVPHCVIVVEHLKYDCLLGKDFMVANKLAIDYGEMSLKFPDGFVVHFTGSKIKKTATLLSDLRTSPRATVAVQTTIDNSPNDLPLITDGGFLASNKLFCSKDNYQSEKPQ